MKFTTSSNELTSQKVPQGQVLKVWITSDDIRNCSISLKLISSEQFQCVLFSDKIAANTSATLLSEKNIFEIFKKENSKIVLQLQADRIVVDVSAKSLRDAGDLIRREFERNMDQVRLVTFAVK